MVNHVKGRMALAHNGNLTNSFELRSALELEGSIFHTTSDTEVISYIITKERLRCPTIEDAVNEAMNKIKGSLFSRHHVPLKAYRSARRKRLPPALLRYDRGRKIRRGVGKLRP